MVMAQMVVLGVVVVLRNHQLLQSMLVVLQVQQVKATTVELVLEIQVQVMHLVVVVVQVVLVEMQQQAQVVQVVLVLLLIHLGVLRLQLDKM